MEKEQGEQYLGILSVLYYVLGAVTGLFSCFPILHLLAGLGMLGISLAPDMEGVEMTGPEWVPAVFGGTFTVVAGVAMAIGWAFAICSLVAAGSLARRRRYTFCIVAAAVACTFVPLGTILGGWTIYTLIQPAVKEMFQTGG